MSAAATARTRSDATYESQIAHANGTADNPLSDQALQEKFFGNTIPMIGEDQSRHVVDLIWSLETLDDIGELVRVCA